MYRLFVVIFLLCAGWCFSFGQKVESAAVKPTAPPLNVRVKDVQENEPISMASVYLIPVGDTTVTAFTFTDKKGAATLPFIPVGRYVVNVQMLGFKPYKEEILLEERIARLLSVKLEEDIQELEGANITAMGDLVAVKGDTLVYHATSFHTASNANLGDLLKKMPGMEVEKGQVKVNGEPVTRITVEGKTFFMGDQSIALENLPAYIVSKINVIDEENRDRFGQNSKRKKMDVRLKDKYRSGWFGRASADGGVSVQDESSGHFDDPVRALYNAKLYSSYYGGSDQLTILGGANNVNTNQLSHNTTGLTDVVSVSANYTTSRIPDMVNTSASASYAFHNYDNRTESERTSFQASGEQLVTERLQNRNTVNHTAKAHFETGDMDKNIPLSEGFRVLTGIRYDRNHSSGESISSTRNSVEKVNGSESRTTGTSDDFAATIGFEGRYILDKNEKHTLSFDGNIGYDGIRGSSEEYSVTRFRESAETQGLLYDDRVDALKFYGNLSYSASCSDHWDIVTTVSADFGLSKNRRDAENADDHSTNDNYSKYEKDRNVNLTESIVAEYGKDFDKTRSISTTFGLCVYEDNLSHISTQGMRENRNNSWTFNIGPVASFVYHERRNIYSILTHGKSILPSGSADYSPTLDISDPINISTGNIYLKSGYSQDVVLNTRLSPEIKNKAVVVVTLRGSVYINDVTRASWYDSSAVRCSIPVNAKRPGYNAGLNVTYTQTLNRKKNLNLTITPRVLFSDVSNYVSNGPLRSLDKENFDYAETMKWFYGDSDGSEFYSGRSGFMENRSLKVDWSVKADLKWEIKAFSIRGGGSVDNSRKDYSTSPTADVNNWRFNAFGEFLWQNNTGWEVETRFDYYGYRGFSDSFNRPEYLLNARLAKAIKSFTISLSAYDIFGSGKSLYHTSSAEYVEDTYHNRISRCILLGLSYSFGKWNRNAQMKRQILEKNSNL